MIAERISIIPIEFFEPKVAARVRKRFEKITLDGQGYGELKVFKALFQAPDLYRVYYLQGYVARLVFIETTLCIILNQRKEYAAFDREECEKCLDERAKLHNRIIYSPDDSEIGPVWSNIKKSLSDGDVYKNDFPSINYVFSFYIFQKTSPTATDDGDLEIWLKSLAEPNILGRDDMLAIREASNEYTTDHVRARTQEIKNTDMIFGVKVYVTWSGIVCLSSQQYTEFQETKWTITALEIRLQATWNRCYSLCKRIERVMEAQAPVFEAENVEITAARAYDDSVSVISANSSSRVVTLFEKLKETSNIAGEVNALQNRARTLEKWIEKERQKKRQIYNRAVEILLFILASTSILGLILDNSALSLSGRQQLFVVVIVLIASSIAAYFLIYKRPK